MTSNVLQRPKPGMSPRSQRRRACPQRSRNIVASCRIALQRPQPDMFPRSQRRRHALEPSQDIVASCRSFRGSPPKILITSPSSICKQNSYYLHHQFNYLGSVCSNVSTLLQTFLPSMDMIPTTFMASAVTLAASAVM